MRGSLLYTIGNLLPRVGAFLMLPIYLAAMGPAEFGTFSLMLSVAGVLGVFLRLGLDGALMRLHFDVAERERGALYTTLTAATAIGGLAIVAVFGVVAAPFFGRLFAGATFWPVGALTLLLTFLLGFQYVPFTFLRATQRPGRFLGLTVAAFGAGLIATIVLVAVLELGAAGALLGQAAGAAMVAVTVVLVIGRMGLASPRVDLLRRSLAFGLPLVPHALSGWVLNLSDRWLIGLLATGEAPAAQVAVGVYAFGYVLGQVVSLLAYSFNAAWVPFFYERGETPNGPPLLREVATLSALVLSVTAVGVGLLAPELSAVLAGDRWGSATADAARVTPVVALASTAYGLYYIVVSAIFLARRTRVLPLLTIAAGAANVGLNVLLIPRIGIMGAAWATLAGYAMLATLSIWYARRVFPLQLDAPRLAVIFLATGALLLLGPVATESLDATAAGGIVHAGIAAGFAVAASFVGREPLARLRALVAAGSPAAVG
jgi:O-antigen/teichoic acid export membrane protein